MNHTYTVAAAALLSAAGVAFCIAQGTQNQSTQNAATSTPSITRTATAAAPSPAAASPDDIAFAKRLSNAFKSVAHNLEPSVVHITQLNRVYQRDFFGSPVSSSIAPTGLGSGFIVSKEGYIVTNNHVVAGAVQLKVRLYDGREVEAKLVGRDELTDLAVIRIDPDKTATPLVPVTFGESDSLDVGEWVVAIGSPFGLSSTVTAGIVSAKGRSITPKETGRVYEDYIQTDAAINPGNSGGPLLNLQGEVVGINSAIASRTGGYEGIGFAIPSDVAKAVLENIVSHGRVVRGWLGVDLAEGAIDSDNGARISGVSVKSVEENSPADAAGLKTGDFITKFQGRPMNEARLRTAIALTPPGTKVPIEVVHEGNPRELTVTLGDQSSAMGNTDVPQLGARVRTITREMANQLRSPRLRGVIVAELDQDGRAAANELQENDIIVAIRQGNSEKAITTAEQFAQAMSKANLGDGLQLSVIRNNGGFFQRGYVQIKE